MHAPGLSAALIASTANVHRSQIVFQCSSNRHRSRQEPGAAAALTNAPSAAIFSMSSAGN
jgi:hypothetical protein